MSVVGVVVDVAPAPWPDAPTVPGLPLLVVPVLLSPVMPLAVEPLVVEPLAVEPAAELLPLPPLVPISLQAARDSAVMPTMRMP